MSNLQEAKSRINLLDYIQSHSQGKMEKLGSGTYRINPCPVCGGKDHFTIYSNSNSYSSFNDCCNGGTIIDYLQEVENYSEEEAYKKTYELAGMEYTRTNNISNTTQTRTNNISNKGDKKAMNEEEKKEAEKQEYIKNQKKAFILNGIAKQTAEDKEKVYEYIEARGISRQTADRFNLFLSSDVYEDKNRQPRVVIPVYHNNEPISYVARAILPVEAKEKALNSAGAQTPLNIDYILQEPPKDNNKIYICEGWADTLSFEDIQQHSIALHSTSNINKLMDFISKNKKTASKYVYVFSLDNDKAGIKATEKAVKIIEEMNEKEQNDSFKIEYDVLKLPKEYKDINEWYKSKPGGFKFALKEYATNFDYINDIFLNDIEKMKDYKGRTTGFRNLDFEINGVYPGLYVLGAISSLGKTTLIHQISDQMASKGEHIIFFSLEQSRFELVAKSISRQTFLIEPKNAKVSLEIMQNSNIADITIEAVRNYQEIANNTIIVEGNFDMNVLTIRKYIESYIQKTGIKPVVILDYLQILRPVNDRWTDKQQVDFNVSELKRISRDNDIPIFTICSFNRENYASTVDFTSFKESGGIEYGADVVMGLQLKVMENLTGGQDERREKINQAKAESPRRIQLIGLKNRNGKSFFKCEFNFYPEYNYFEEATTNTIFNNRPMQTSRKKNSFDYSDLPF